LMAYPCSSTDLRYGRRSRGRTRSRSTRPSSRSRKVIPQPSMLRLPFPIRTLSAAWF
jgi:hypothetical protein